MTTWLIGIVGEAAAPTVSLVLTIILIIIAVIFLVWLVRMLLGGRFSSRHNPELRLQVVDATLIDNRRKLVLVRRDNVEHLIVIGGQNDFVVESGIVAPSMTSKKPAKRDAAARPQPVAQPHPSPVATKPATVENRPTPPAAAAPKPSVAPTPQAPRSYESANTAPIPPAQAVIAPAPAPSQKIAPPLRPVEKNPAPDNAAPDVEIAGSNDLEFALDAEMDALINNLTTKSG